MIRILFVSTILLGSSLFFWKKQSTEPTGVILQGAMPPLSSLTPTPRAQFTPTSRKGYWNIDVVGDFTLPATKSITFCGAGRNLHVQQDWGKLFRRGFSAVDRTRMIDKIDIWLDVDHFPRGWKSRLKPSQRTLWIGANYFRSTFNLNWVDDSEKARETYFKRPERDPNYRNSLYQACEELRSGCVYFGDCPETGWKSTYGKIFLDVENEGTSMLNRQEHANLYVYMAKAIKDHVAPQTEVGSIAPVPHNGFGNSNEADYQVEAEWLWRLPARHTATSKRRGMPDEIVGKSFADYADFQMPGTYFVYPDFDYNARHSGESDRHWLAGVLQEQEVNAALSPKKRIAWQWLFNTQSSSHPNSQKSSHPAPPAVAEGLGIFYWFTGAYGSLFWDDAINLTPDQPTPSNPNDVGQGNDRNYACYEHYIHGLWRLFKHHGDLFNGKETYLNQNTECSYDGGRTWFKYNASQLKTRNLPFVRAIVNGNQVLVAATKPYAGAGQKSSVMFRYTDKGYQFYTTITLTGDEIFLGRATMAPRS